MDTPGFADRIKFMAQFVEKFVEQNLMEKEQRDENLKKLAVAFEAFVKESPLRTGFAAAKSAASGAASAVADVLTAHPSVVVRVKTLENFKGDLPKHQTSLASGVDVRAQISAPITLEVGQRALIATGLSVAIPAGYEIQARPRSGWAIRDGVTVLNSPGTIDADYRGELKMIVANFGEKAVVINDQDRIAQLVLCPVVAMSFDRVESLDDTDRGAGGFGSTGKS